MLQREPVTGGGPRGSDIPLSGSVLQNTSNSNSNLHPLKLDGMQSSQLEKQMRERETERKSELAPASFKQHASQKVTKNFLSLLFFFRQQKSSLCLCLYSHLQISFRLYHFKILDFCRFFKIAIVLQFFQIFLFIYSWYQ